MIHNLKCQVSGTIVGTIELPDNLSAEEILRRTHTQSGVVAEGYSLLQPVPEKATPATIRIALRRLHGISNVQLQNTINSIFAQIQDDAARDEAETLWEYAIEIQRTHPLVEVIGNALQLNTQQIDEVFRVANTI